MDLGALVSGLLTGLREGVEAALIVSIVITYLVRSGRPEQIGRVWIGTGLAAVISLVVGIVIYSTVGAFEAPYEQIFEGTTLLVAAVVVTWMLFWMRRQARSVKSELQAAVDRTIAGGASWGLAALAFTAVIREGLETSIFLVGQAASNRTEAGWILVGAFAGLAIAILIGYGFYRGSSRLNLASFFRWTGIGLVFIAAGLLSHGIGEFIEIGALGNGPWTATAFDISGVLSDETGVGSFLRAIFGYSAAPAVLTLAAHVGYLVVILALFLRPARRPLPPAPSAPETVTARS
ncbi:MAG TPA: iron uptake transporter permease EfeU [Candidatus Limnocylindrales bacterium]|nr:iron uptake transporter permease EfeU [Candidatus Limnocylindrales bacterium]